MKSTWFSLILWMVFSELRERRIGFGSLSISSPARCNLFPQCDFSVFFVLFFIFFVFAFVSLFVFQLRFLFFVLNFFKKNYFTIFLFEYSIQIEELQTRDTLSLRSDRNSRFFSFFLLLFCLDSPFLFMEISFLWCWKLETKFLNDFRLEVFVSSKWYEPKNNLFGFLFFAAAYVVCVL